ncbi:hypothetical protein NMG60_11031801 [Bertholletia excelsa]
MVVCSASASYKKVFPSLLKSTSVLCSSTNRYTSLSKTLVNQITTAFLQENLELLDPKSISSLRPRHVEPILFHLRSNAGSAIRFFEWSEHVIGFNHTLESFCGLAHVLLGKRMFDPARQVFDRMAVKFEIGMFLAFCTRGFRATVQILAQYVAS